MILFTENVSKTFYSNNIDLFMFDVKENNNVRRQVFQAKEWRLCGSQKMLYDKKGVIILR